MKSSVAAAALIVAASLAGAQAGPFARADGLSSQPFTATLSNNTPLAFGMDASAVTQALGTPLNYVRGRPGDEIFLAFRNVGGSGLFFHKDRLYLQFRKGKLTGWKGDWGHNWMWQ